MIRGRQIKALLITAYLLLVSGGAFAGRANVESVRVWVSPDYTRLVFDVSGPVKHKITMEEQDQRIVIDIPQSQLTATTKKLQLKNSPITSIQTSVKNKKDVRIILNLKNACTSKSFTLKPNQQYGDRLVVDLFGKKTETKNNKEDEAEDIIDQEKGKYAKLNQQPTEALPISESQNSNKKENTEITKTTAGEYKPIKIADSNRLRPIIIAIDAGHGGEDPGAAGPKNIKEKIIALQIAKKLADIINDTPGYKAVLTRKGDYFIELRQRPLIARKAKADLFVSIHADAFTNKTANGASVFAVSERGSTSEAARILADRENSADLVGGVSLDDKDKMLAGVLLDLSSTASMSASLKVGDNVLRSLHSLTPLHSKQVEQAGFMVLKSPDMPSILVETGFISNPSEAAKLSNSSYQATLAKAIQKGIVQHLAANPPAGVQLATMESSDDSR
jgi:N-acetylmuramoyl-L-alanine amidase